MKTKLVITFILLIILSSCSKKLYKEYSFKQKDVRELKFYFINDTLGSFKVKYLCSNVLIDIEQKFIYKETSEGIFSFKGIGKQKSDSFIYVPLEKLNNCVKSKQSISIEKIPLIIDEEIVIYKKSLFWQKVENGKVISALLFKAR